MHDSLGGVMRRLWSRFDEYVLINHGAVWSIGVHRALVAALVCAAVESLIAWAAPGLAGSSRALRQIIGAELVVGLLFYLYWMVANIRYAGSESGLVLRSSRPLALLAMAVLFPLLVLVGPLLLSSRIGCPAAEDARRWCPRDFVLLMYLMSALTTATIVTGLRRGAPAFPVAITLFFAVSYILCEVVLGVDEPIRTVLFGGTVALGLLVCLRLRLGITLLGNWAGFWALMGLALVPWVPGGRPVVEMWQGSGVPLDEFMRRIALGVVQTAVYMYCYRRAFQWYDVQPRPDGGRE